MKSGRWIIALCLLCLSALVWAGGAQEKTQKGPVTLTVWDFKYGETEGAGPAFKEMDEMFMKKYADIKVNHVAQPHDQYYEVVRAAVSAGSEPDVAMFHAEQRAWAMADYLVTLDEYVKPYRGEISEAIWNTCSPTYNAKDGIKLAPLTMQGLGFYYNKDLFKKAGLNPDKAPADWTEFLAACEALKKAGITPFIWGNTPAYYSNWFERTLACTFYGDAGTRKFQSGQSNFTDPEFRTLVAMIKELRDKEYLDPKGASMPLFMDAIEKFKTGQGAIFLGLLSDIAHWKDFCDALGNDKVGYFPNINHPSAKFKDAQNSSGAGIGFSIMTYSKLKDKAALYLQHYVTGEAPKVFVKKTGAIVPNGNIDYSSLGYPVLTQILTHVAKAGTPDFVAFVPAAANNDLQAYDQLLFNSKEISIEKYIEEVQKSLVANRK